MKKQDGFAGLQNRFREYITPYQVLTVFIKKKKIYRTKILFTETICLQIIEPGRVESSTLKNKKNISINLSRQSKRILSVTHYTYTTKVKNRVTSMKYFTGFNGILKNTFLFKHMFIGCLLCVL